MSDIGPPAAAPATEPGADASRRRRRRRSEASEAAENRAGPARAERSRRRTSDTGRRILLVLLGLLVALGSVAGFYFTSDAFDRRVPVTVAAFGLEVGDTVQPGDLTSSLVVAGSLPHVPWTPLVSAEFEGLVAAQRVPLGGLVRHDMFIAADTVPVGVSLEVVIPLDVSLATEGVADFDHVLLVDPGALPTAEAPGRPRKVLRDYELRNFDGSQMRLFETPEAFAEWERLKDQVGGTFMVVPLGLGGGVEETAQRLDAVWHEQWTEAVAEVEAARIAAQPQPDAGELEVVVSLDTSLVPTPIGADALVLLIDPGAEPVGNDPGRPRRVLRSLQLAGFEGGSMRLFVPPEEWHYWQSLPDELGATPMALPVTEGTNVEDMSERLNAVWNSAWEAALADHVATR